MAGTGAALMFNAALDIDWIVRAESLRVRDSLAGA